jgi:thioredoxin-related protein
MKFFYNCLLILFLIGCGNSKSVPAETNSIETENTEVVTEIVDAEVEEVVDNTSINWLDFETAIEKNKTDKKFIFIDVYTDWCGWCKKMDASTFANQEVITYMNNHFYAVKMNAESRAPIVYKEHLFEYKQYNVKAGYNELSVSLLNSKMSFPSFVVLNKNEVKKGNIAGYKDVPTLMGILKGYVGK